LEPSPIFSLSLPLDPNNIPLLYINSSGTTQLPLLKSITLTFVDFLLSCYIASVATASLFLFLGATFGIGGILQAPLNRSSTPPPLLRFLHLYSILPHSSDSGSKRTTELCMLDREEGVLPERGERGFDFCKMAILQAENLF